MHLDETDKYPKLMAGDIIGRYELIRKVGVGAQGEVVKARIADDEYETELAIKLMRLDDDRNVREGQILSELRYEKFKWNDGRPTHVIDLVDQFRYRGYLGLVFQYYRRDWHSIMVGGLGEKRLIDLEVLRTLTRQMLTALKFLKNSGIIHCDLKPENIMYHSPSASSYLSDFGHSVHAGRSGVDGDQNYYAARGTLEYLSPEMIMQTGIFGYQSDMWALGATLYSISTYHRLIEVRNRKGTNSTFKEALADLLVRVPPEQDTRKVYMMPIPFETARKPSGNKTMTFKEDMERRLVRYRNHGGGDDFELFIDFIAKLLKWDPNKRMTVEQALQHPFVQTHDF